MAHATAKRKRFVISCYIMILALVIDTGTGAFSHSFLTMAMIYELMHSSTCWVYYIQAKSFRPTTALSLSVVAAISAERYFGVVHPLIHRTKITKVRLSQLLLFTWFSCAIVSVPAYFHDNPFQVFATISIMHVSSSDNNLFIHQDSIYCNSFKSTTGETNK